MPNPRLPLRWANTNGPLRLSPATWFEIASIPECRHIGSKSGGPTTTGQISAHVAVDSFDSLPPQQHDARLLQGAEIAHRRYQSCLPQLEVEDHPNATNPDLLALGPHWTELGRPTSRRLEGNAPLQDRITTWINQAENVTAKICGPPTGDDALLLQLAQTPDKTE